MLSAPTGDLTSAHTKFGLSKQFRLLDSQDFGRVFADGKRSADKFFTILYLPSNRGMSRVGFAVAKKRLPRAVDRNRIRRVARESFRKNRDSLGSIDIVIMARSQASRATKLSLFQSLERHWAGLRDQQAGDAIATDEKH
ncbi:MAG: ribonuclease P protein component [Gammaproteobacteria bacterium]